MASTANTTDNVVPIGEPRKYIAGIDVRYGRQAYEAPEGRIHDINGLSENINDGFGGSYVWLVPQHSPESTQAFKKLDICIQSAADSSLKNLADGAGGSYRYLYPVQAGTTSCARFTMVALYRASQPLTSTPPGWDNFSRDINEGRDAIPGVHVYLYILWRATTAT